MMLDYHVKFETFTIGDTSVQIRSLKDQQQFSDPDGISEQAGISSATWPLFGIIWPSSIILANAINTYPIEGIRILEIGCGLALASLVASHRGADITASDYHPLAESFLKENVILNHFPAIKYATGDWSKSDSTMGKFDLIIGSDLLYEPNHPELLSDFILNHSSKAATVIIVDPNRRQQSQFTNKMLKLGYSCTSVSVTTPLADALHFKGKILTYLRQED